VPASAVRLLAVQAVSCSLLSTAKCQCLSPENMMIETRAEGVMILAKARACRVDGARDHQHAR